MEQNLKQRIVGALVLVSLAVIFLPLVFDRQRQRIDTAAYAIPEKPALTITAPDATPLEQEARAEYQTIASVEAARAEQDAASGANAITDQLPTATDGEDAAPPPASTNPASLSQSREYLEKEKQVDASLRDKPVTQVADLADAWVIQVGAFSNSANAKTLQDKLKSAGYPAFVKSTRSSSGTTLHKVFVGPEIRRADLDHQKTELERKYQLKALILKYIP